MEVNIPSVDDLAAPFSGPAIELVVGSESDAAPLVIARMVEAKHCENRRVLNGNEIDESVGREVDAEHVRVRTGWLERRG